MIALTVGFLIFGLIMTRAGWERLSEALVLFLSFKGILIVLLTLVIAAISILTVSYTHLTLPTICSV